MTYVCANFVSWCHFKQSVTIALDNGHLMVLFINDGDQLFDLDGGKVTLDEWHDLLLEMSDLGSG